jgi:hypothetical protein
MRMHPRSRRPNRRRARRPAWSSSAFRGAAQTTRPVFSMWSPRTFRRGRSTSIFPIGAPPGLSTSQASPPHTTTTAPATREPASALATQFTCTSIRASGGRWRRRFSRWAARPARRRCLPHTTRCAQSLHLRPSRSAPRARASISARAHDGRRRNRPRLDRSLRSHRCALHPRRLQRFLCPPPPSLRGPSAPHRPTARSRVRSCPAVADGRVAVATPCRATASPASKPPTRRPARGRPTAPRWDAPTSPLRPLNASTGAACRSRAR